MAMGRSKYRLGKNHERGRRPQSLLIDELKFKVLDASEWDIEEGWWKDHGGSVFYSKHLGVFWNQDGLRNMRFKSLNSLAERRDETPSQNI